MSMRQAVHEVSHGIIAVVNGYILNAVRLDGPAERPGQTDRTIPGGLDGNDPVWARKELALFCAGYVGERVYYGWNEEGYVTGHPECDRPMMDQCALVHLGNQPDIAAVLAYQDPGQDWDTPRHQWRHAVNIDWAPYDNLIQVVAEEVRLELETRKFLIGHLARLLLGQLVIPGAQFVAEMQ